MKDIARHGAGWGIRETPSQAFEAGSHWEFEMRNAIKRRRSLATLAGVMRGAGVMALALAAVPASAQQVAAPAMFERIAPPPSPAPELLLYPSQAPAPAPDSQNEVWDRMLGSHPVVRNVTRPTITPFLPAPEKATGAAVLILPGGGFTMLSMDAEGWAIARWLAERGVAAFVLKYRTAQTPADEKALMGSLATSMAALMTDPEKTMVPLAPPAVADAVQALKMLRAGASTWKIDPARVGMIGFSAGAMATRDVVLTADPAVRPAFFASIYGPMREVSVPAGAPPMFIALALDDPLFGNQGFGLVSAWHKAARPAELHAYEQGGHGFRRRQAGHDEHNVAAAIL
ncbi:alpha/beta hydrolase [Novosphingobium sp. G106]|uniref:alpha/beta hydrolase n=1 Tax=Novosphingobium sp. G106 TaxID=2849500 RepID=UPI0020C51CA0|nr:alpha/beta hydrolase [Novosphingobium sp. G106]